MHQKNVWGEEMFYKDKRVLVTGGAGGIGRAIALAYAAQGASVAITDADAEAGAKTLKELTEISSDCSFFECDLSSAEQTQMMIWDVFERYDDLDIIINNAGVSRFAPLTEFTNAEFDYVINTNLRSQFIISREFLRHREETGGNSRYGRIVCISSTRHLMSEPGNEAYAASKGGIVSLTHALAASFHKHNVTVNCISPGWVCTGDYGLLTEADHSQHLSGRVGLPEDIASACLFLTAEENDFINGQNIYIDGGMTKKMIYTE